MMNRTLSLIEEDEEDAYTNEEIAEDLADVHGKLKMLDADFTIQVKKSRGPRETSTISLTKTSTDIDTLFLNGLSEGEKISNIIIYIYNKETVQAMDFLACFCLSL